MLLIASQIGFGVVYVILALLVGLTFHEASHALVAKALGDDTPRRMGRLSLNPFAHLDPFGTLMILLVGIGWGKPVAIDANRLRPGPKVGMALVGIAGPISNLVLATILALPLRFHWLSFSGPMISVAGIRTYFSSGCVFETLVSFSLGLAVFNLIPISPLDGSRIWQVLLPQRWYNTYARYEILGIILVVALVLGDAWLHLGILDRLLLPALNWLWQPIVGFGHPFSCIID